MVKRTVLAVLVLAAVMPAARAVGTSPSNDNFADAKSITSLPYSDQESTAGATTESGEPTTSASGWCSDVGATVWYAFTPLSDVAVQADTLGSDFNTELGVYVHDSTGSLHLVACDSSKTVFGARSGWTYYFQVGGARNITTDTSYLIPPTGSLSFKVAEDHPQDSDDDALFVPPVNDDRAQATTINALPFSERDLVGAASLEPGEPMCSRPTGVTVSETGGNASASANQSVITLSAPTSVWYRYTADHDATLLGHTNRHYGADGFGVYEDSPTGLQRVACGFSVFFKNSYAGDTNGDDAFALIPVRKDHTYLIQVVGDVYDLPWDTQFSLTEEPTSDLVVSNVTVTAGNGVPDARTVGFDMSEYWVDAFATWSLSVCPGSSPTGCTPYEDLRGDPKYADDCSPTECFLHVETNWNTAGCAGDYTVQIHVDDPFNADPNPSNNTASAQTIVGVGGHGIGVPCVPPTVHESVPPSP